MLEAKENIIGHQVNCKGKMGSGVAKQVRAKFPIVYEEYIDLVDKDVELLGKVQTVKVGKKKYIANLFGQDNYGFNDGIQHTNTRAIFKCFQTLRKVAERNNVSVALPYGIGCYRGGADWAEVERLLITAFDGYEVTLYKYDEE